MAQVRPNHSYDDLVKRLLSADKWLKSLNTSDKRHTFVAAGFIGEQPVASVVSNFQTAHGLTLEQAEPDLNATHIRPRKPQILVTGSGSRFVTKADRSDLKERVRAGVNRIKMHKILADLNQRVAEFLDSKNLHANNDRFKSVLDTVGPECFTTDLQPNGASEWMTHRLSDALPFMPPQVKALLDQHGIQINPKLDENGNPMPIKIRGMTSQNRPNG